MILCTGELIADITTETLPDIGEIMRRRAGGAPFNVACDIVALGGSAGFYGCVGSDLMGDMLASYAKGATGLDPLVLRRDPHRPTAMAFVEIGPDGDRAFEFRDASRAADCAADAAELETLLPRARLLHLGSLMLRDADGRRFAASAVSAAHARGIAVSFDVNLRPGLYKSVSAALRAAKPVVDAADILKFSSEEALLFTHAPDERSAALALSRAGRTVFVTLGARGALCACGDECISVPAMRADVVDATGAGDAFFAGALLSLVTSPGDLHAALAAGVRAGAGAVSRKASNLL